MSALYDPPFDTPQAVTLELGAWVDLVEYLHDLVDEMGTEDAWGATVAEDADEIERQIESAASHRHLGMAS